MDIGTIFKSLVIGLPIGLLLVVVAAAAFLWITGPVRRRERALLFFDLIGYGLERGQSPERTVHGLSASRETCLGSHFHLVALECAQGRRLSEALEKVPEFLPPRIAKIIALGEELGDVGKVLPICRETVRIPGQSRDGTVATLALVPGASSLLLVAVMAMINTVIVPKFHEIFEGLAAGTDSAAGLAPGMALLDTRAWRVLPLLLLLVSLVVFALADERFLALRRFLPGHRFFDNLTVLLPWTRLRLKRDFSAMLALLLDAGVPEEQAVRRAAEATGNPVIAGMGGRMAADLRSGTALPKAILKRGLDRSFSWTLVNCLRSGRDFFAALRSANDAMSLRAERLEQQAAGATVAFVTLLNGAVIALCVIGLFHVFISIMEGIVE